jgi:hypothetical protein
MTGLHAMALDKAALLELTVAMSSTDGSQLTRRLLHTIPQALIDAEATEPIGTEPPSGQPRQGLGAPREPRIPACPAPATARKSTRRAPSPKPARPDHAQVALVHLKKVRRCGTPETSMVRDSVRVHTTPDTPKARQQQLASL